MEREDSVEVKSSVVIENKDWVKRKLCVPTALYSCPECGAEFFWMKGTKLRQISEPTLDLATLMEKNKEKIKSIKDFKNFFIKEMGVAQENEGNIEDLLFR